LASTDWYMEAEMLL
jgi:uncharacterized protein (TIGR03083 family)